MRNSVLLYALLVTLTIPFMPTGASADDDDDDDHRWQGNYYATQGSQPVYYPQSSYYPANPYYYQVPAQVVVTQQPVYYEPAPLFSLILPLSH